MTSGTTALDFLFGGLTTTTNAQYERRKLDFCGYNRLFPQIDLSLTEANNQYQNIIIIAIIIIIIIIIINIITIMIELTHIKTIVENTVKIEPQSVALDFKNLSQYSSRPK